MRNKYLLLRHGESTFNRDMRYQGWSKGVPLTERGADQVRGKIKLVKKFKPDFIVASPFLRTRQTAEMLAKEVKKEILFSKLIIDYRRSASMEGKLQEEYVDTPEYKDWLEKADKDWDFKLPDGESYNDFNLRVREFLDILDKNYEGKRILVVTHGDVIRAIIRQLTGKDLKPLDVVNAFACEMRLAKSSGGYVCEEVR